MSDYIDRETVINHLDDCMDTLWKPEIAALKCYVEGLPSADVAPQWISVKDELPEVGQEVLAVSHGWRDKTVYVGQYGKIEAQTSPLTGITSKASDWLLWGWSYIKEPQVTHWMPLPEPPKGGEDDDDN